MYKNTNGSQLSPTPISIAVYRSPRFSSSYGLFAGTFPEGPVPCRMHAEACFRGSAASLDEAVPYPFRCKLSWFPGILLDRLLNFRNLLQLFSIHQRQDRHLRDGGEISIPVSISPTPFCFPGRIPLAVLMKTSERTEWLLYAHLMNQIYTGIFKKQGFSATRNAQ